MYMLTIPLHAMYQLNGHRPPAKSALQKMARGGEGGSARRENKPYITGAEAKVYATLKSDTIMVIVVYTDSHADQGERTSYVDEKYLNLNGKIRRF